MTTVVNNPPGTDRVVEKSDTGGWAVAVIILLAVIAIGGFLWMRYYRGAAAPAPTGGSANINLTLPAGSTGGTEGTPSNNASAQ